MATILSPILGHALPTGPTSLERWCRIFDWRTGGYITATQNAPPGSPADGRAWVVGTGTGAWAGLDGRVVIWWDAASEWIALPAVGTATSNLKGLGPIWHADAGAYLGHDGTDWNDTFELEP